MPATSQQPKVSIIMPTYNRAGLIAESIRSVQDQTYPNWELIIVDDGSEDNTKDVVASIHDQRIIFLEAGRTGIVGRLKNRAIEKASGSLLAFIDSDDLWHATKLEKQVAALQEYPEAGFCLVNGYNFNQSGEVFDYFYKQKEGARHGDLFLACFQSEVSGYTQALLMRKDCIAISGSFKEDKTFSDAEFIIALAHRFKAIILYEPLVFRRLHQTNYIHSTWAKSMDEGIEIIRQYKYLVPSKIVRNSFFKLYIAYGEKYLENGEHWNAFKKFGKAWTQKPFNIIPVKKMGKTLLQFLRIN
jgi:glycosyltransferase involved in cell wall biosynthesis